jgi:hypothetical protein
MVRPNVGPGDRHASRRGPPGRGAHVHPRERWTPDGAPETIVRVNRSLAKTLLALSYPLRYTAHLTAGHRTAGADG